MPDAVPGRLHHDGGLRTGRGERLRATAWIAGLALAVLLLDLGPLGAGVRSITGHHDNASFSYPLRLEAARQWRDGRVPLWNPYSLAGTPLLGDITSAVLYPGNLPLLLDVDGPRYRALDRVALLHFVLAALFMYGFARALSLGRAAAALSGLVYAGNGPLLYFTSQWIQIQNSAVWLPLILTAVHRGADRRRLWLWIAVGSVAVALQVLSGYPQNVFYTGLVAGAYALTLALGRSGKGWCPVIALTSMYVLGAALAAVQLAPSLEVAAMSPRSSPVSIGDFLASAVSPGNLVRGLVTPLGLATPAVPYPLAGSLFVGTLTAVLAIEGTRSLQRERVFFGIALVVTFLLALGPHTPVGWLSYHVPGLNFFRYPSKHLFEVTFCVAALAGFGAQSVVDRRRGAAACATIAALGVLWILATAPLSWSRGVAMASTVAFAALVLAGRGPAAVLVALASIWLGLASNRSGPLGLRPPAESLREAAQTVVDALAGRQPTVLGPRYVAALVPRLVFVPPEPLLALDYATEARVPAVHGTTPFLWRPLGAALQMGDTGVFAPRIFADPRDQTLDVLSVQFVGSPAAPGKVVPGAKPDVRVVARDGSLPTIRFVDRAICMGPEATSLELRRRKHDLAAVALVDCGDRGDPRVAPASARSKIALLENAAGLLRMEVRLGAGGPGLLIVSQADVPGWQARIDGAPAPIYRAYGLVQGIVLPEGVHELELRYLPGSFVAGGWISLAALAALLGVGALALRARQTPAFR